MQWWKWLGAIIVLYSIVAGMLLPLRPGIVAVSPGTARTGDSVSFQVVGYNSHFKSGQSSLRAWLKLDEKNAMVAKKITAVDERNIWVEFDIPAFLPDTDRVQAATLLLDNEIDGYSLLPNAVFITQDSIDPQASMDGALGSNISNLHDAKGITFPFRNILKESIRNTYFHVVMWFAMLFLFVAGAWQQVQLLRRQDLDRDRKALAHVTMGTVFGFLGLITGMIWATFTWGAPWSGDPKQNMTAIALLVYLAFFVLRYFFEDEELRARISAIYGIFAFVMLIPLIYIIPRMTDSLHPGAGGNPALGGEDLDNTMRLVFYPAIVGWTLIGFWISSQVYRYLTVKNKLEELEQEF